MAFPDGTGPGKLSRWTPIVSQLLAGGAEALPDLEPRALQSSTNMGLYSHVALSQCAFSTSLVGFHTRL